MLSSRSHSVIQKIMQRNYFIESNSGQLLKGMSRKEHICVARSRQFIVIGTISTSREHVAQCALEVEWVRNWLADSEGH